MRQLGNSHWEEEMKAAKQEEIDLNNQIIDNLINESVERQQQITDVQTVTSTVKKGVVETIEANEKKIESDKKVVESVKEVNEAEDTLAQDRATRRGELIREIEKLENDFLESQLDRQTKEENAVREKYFALIEEAKEFNLETATLEEAREQELFDIRQEFREQESEAIAEMKAEMDEIEEADRQAAAENRENTIALAKQSAEDLFNVAQQFAKKQSEKDLSACGYLCANPSHMQ